MRTLSKGKNRMWNRRCIAKMKMPVGGFCVAWHPTKMILAVGTTSAEILVYGLTVDSLTGSAEAGVGSVDITPEVIHAASYGRPQIISGMKFIARRSVDMKKDVAAAAEALHMAIPRRHKDKPTSFQKKFAEELKEKGKNNKKQKRKQKMFKAKEECSDIRFSPNGLWLAAASRDNNIYIFDVMRNYKKVGCCKGHSSYITHIDFSADSNFIPTMMVPMNLVLGSRCG